ncbi:hypothetical protein AB0N05_17575 [Nocardia sp. NPDC051030]|uniref:hypothetical protein n=1 Tax=Nocardia sp. NPDC051030 TaxID=3155162 RepID=UPI00342A285A
MTMSTHQRFRTIVVAGSAVLVLALGAAPLTIATSGANPNYPLGSDPGTPGQPPKKDEKVEKAEKLGGSTITGVLDLAENVLKCGLNIAIPTVKCS